MPTLLPHCFHVHRRPSRDGGTLYPGIRRCCWCGFEQQFQEERVPDHAHGPVLGHLTQPEYWVRESDAVALGLDARVCVRRTEESRG